MALQQENKDLLSSISVDNRLLDVLHMGLRIFDRLMLLNMLLLHQEWADLGLSHVLEQARTTERFKDTTGVASATNRANQRRATTCRSLGSRGVVSGSSVVAFMGSAGSSFISTGSGDCS